MINLNEQYPNKTAGVTANYPFGQARNVTLPGDRKGTPWDQALVNDLIGFQQAAMKAANMVPSGVPDNANTSQVLEALLKIIDSSAFWIGKKWKNLTSSRLLNTLYVNTTNKPLEVALSLKHTASTDNIVVYVDNYEVYSAIDVGTSLGWIVPIFFTVNPGESYKVTSIYQANYNLIERWSEK